MHFCSLYLLVDESNAEHTCCNLRSIHQLRQSLRSLCGPFFTTAHPHNSALRYECSTAFRPSVCGMLWVEKKIRNAKAIVRKHNTPAVKQVPPLLNGAWHTSARLKRLCSCRTNYGFQAVPSTSGARIIRSSCACRSGSISIGLILGGGYPIASYAT